MALLVGDLGVDPPWGPDRQRAREAHDASVRRVIARVSDAVDGPVLFVPGNHDLPDPPDDVSALNVDGRIVEVEGLRVAGFGGAGPDRFGFPYEWSEEEARGKLEGFLGDGAGRVDLCLCHAPPIRTALDRTQTGEHVGSAAVSEALLRVRPSLFVCGHIHESAGMDRVDGVLCLNAGALGDPYGREIAWVVSWEDGLDGPPESALERIGGP